MHFNIIHFAIQWLKPGFHYPSWRPELTGDQFPLPVNSASANARPSTRPVNSASGNAHPATMETGHPLTRAANSGSGNRALKVQTFRSFLGHWCRYSKLPFLVQTKRNPHQQYVSEQSKYLDERSSCLMHDLTHIDQASWRRWRSCSWRGRKTDNETTEIMMFQQHSYQ